MAGTSFLPLKSVVVAAAAAAKWTSNATANSHKSCSIPRSMRLPFSRETSIMASSTLLELGKTSIGRGRRTSLLHVKEACRPQKPSNPKNLRLHLSSAATTSSSPLRDCVCFSSRSVSLGESDDKWGCLAEDENEFIQTQEENVVASAAGAGRRHLMVGATLLSTTTTFWAATAAIIEDSTTEFPLESYRDAKNGFTLLRPASWNKVDKPGAVIYFEDPKIRSSNIGVTVAPVKIASLDGFGTVDDVAKKLVKAERDKESTKDVQVINQFERRLRNDIRLYSLEYTLDTTRGGKRILTSVTVAGSKLYVLSIAFAEDGVNSAPPVLKNALHQVLGSFELLT